MGRSTAPPSTWRHMGVAGMESTRILNNGDAVQGDLPKYPCTQTASGKAPLPGRSVKLGLQVGL